MSSPIDSILAALFARSGPAQVSGQMPDPKPLPPEDDIVSPDSTRPNPPDQRMEGWRRLVTNLTYTMGTGLTAASQNARGRGQRNQAGMGAILQQPKLLQDAQEALRQKQEAEAMQKKQFLAQLLQQSQQGKYQDATIAQGQDTLAETKIRDATTAANNVADNARADKAAKDAEDRKNAEEAAGTLIPGSEANVINPQTNKPARSQQFRVRQPDGSYKYETRYTDPLFEKPSADKSLQNDEFTLKDGSHKLLSFDPTPTPEHRAGTYTDNDGKDVTTQVVGKYKPVTPTNPQTGDNASYKTHLLEMDKRAKPIDESAGRFARLRDTLSQGTAQADALVAPELMTVMAGGIGSGVRITNAEIDRVHGGRPMIADIQAKIRKWLGTDQKSAINFGTEERQAINDLMNIVGTKLDEKQSALSDFADLNSRAGTTEQQRRAALAALDKKMRDIDNVSGKPAMGNSAVPSVGGTFNGQKVLKVEKLP